MSKLGHLLGFDPTLAAADRALEQKAAEEQRRGYLGMSQIGEDCWRKLWYYFRWAFKEQHDHTTLKRFLDGHASEDVQADRLRLIPSVKLETKNPVTGEQWRYVDHDGHFSGHCDGKITGVLQAPVKMHIWEAKAVGEKKLTEFRKIKGELGEKLTLRKWNPVYYAQAQLYMHYEGTDRHYLTVSSPGVRDWDSCRTEYDPAAAIQLRSKALKIIKSDEPLDKVSNKADWFECKRCPARFVCHEGEMPHRTCRTCLHSTPIENGSWHCERFGRTLTLQEQEMGCPAHKFLPKLVPGDVVDATDTSVTYKMADGSLWTDSEGDKSDS